ncbi:glycosyltransferase family 1 protein [Cereibacter changlensis JA139]|uniref:Glycosyltransferase family 1 protein n=2 Tax=Cereibacter changlensis TaxID=402884 RepID=A0A2T4K0Q3_9RHOB|nr:glycosyltransferase [Cereibacter changlensis]PTE23730.1 glycosyltransferase family 1 protein [Cereibacter changlensis JA139]PZX59065.1 glycosyl transferase family 1 [Cereibacter changlensis]
MRAAAPARLLDLTRLLSRLGQGPLTGVDRVEAAWLDHLLDAPQPCFGLLRTRLGFLLLDRKGMQALRDRLEGLPLGPADLAGRLFRRSQPWRAKAEADMRRLACDRCLAPLLSPLLRRHLPAGSCYLNLGHANLSEFALRRIRAAGLRVVVLVHDVIPLEHPEFTRPGIPAVFRRKMAAVSAGADLVIHSTEDARRRTEAQLARLGRTPPGITAPLGVPMPRPDPATPLPALRYFVAVGTIEPRKNHALLLDVWDRLEESLPAGEVPQLLLLGRRGWNNDEVFQRLDARARSGSAVREHPDLPDGAVAALLAGAEALLFPSFAEGYGLPPLEAMALGVPVLCSNLPVFAETLGDYPVYLDPNDRYLWIRVIAGRSPAGGRPPARGLPDWASHFRAVTAACDAL